jgi:hypothetical protein
MNTAEEFKELVAKYQANKTIENAKRRCLENSGPLNFI